MKYGYLYVDRDGERTPIADEMQQVRSRIAQLEGEELPSAGVPNSTPVLSKPEDAEPVPVRA